MSFKPYPKYKESGVEWLGRVPEHWGHTRLKRLVDPVRPITYGIVQAGTHIPDGVPYIRPADMSDEKGIVCSDTLLRTSPEVAAAYTRSMIRPGDLICSIGPSFGKVMVTPDWLVGANLTQGTARVAIRGPNSSRYVFWLLRSEVCFGQWESAVGGATFRALNLGPLAETVVAMPTPSEQAAIAAFLDHETAKIDALIAEQQRLIELLQEKRQAVISHAVTKGLNPDAPMKDSGIEWLGEVPEHWEVRPVKHLTESIKAGPFGSSLTKDVYVDSGYRVYGQEQVIPNDFSLGDYYITQEKYDELAQCSVAPGDVLISCVGTFGKIAIVPADAEPGIINPRLLRVRCSGTVAPMYFAEVLRSQVAYEQFAVLSRGGTMDVINAGTLSSIVVPVPPSEEQVELLSCIRAEASRCDSLVSEADCSIALLQERRSALISAAVTGQIDVRDFAPGGGSEPV